MGTYDLSWHLPGRDHRHVAAQLPMKSLAAIAPELVRDLLLVTLLAGESLLAGCEQDRQKRSENGKQASDGNDPIRCIDSAVDSFAGAVDDFRKKVEG